MKIITPSDIYWITGLDDIKGFLMLVSVAGRINEN